MGRGLSTLALLVVLIGLGAYIYFADRTPDDPLQDHVFGTLGSDEIEEVEIRRGDEAARARRENGEWRIVEPIDTDGDRTELSVITGAIATLTRQRVVVEDADDLAQYGLDPPRIDVGFRTTGEPGMRRILIGDRTPGGSDLYARLAGERQVFLVSSFLESTFDKDAFALRDRTILRFERDEVRALDLQAADSRLRFERDGNDWRIVQPIAARADYGAVEGAVQRLGSGRMQTIVADETDDLRPYGLDRPVATMTVHTGDGPAILTLGATEDALVFARDASRPLVFTVAPTLQTDVIKPVEDFRRRDLFDARTFSTTRLELRRGDRTTVLERASGDEGDTWREAGGDVVDRDRVEQLLTRLTFLRASSFEATAPAALRSPELTVEIRFDGDRSETVAFARPGDGGVVAARADEPGAARLDVMTYDEAIEALEALMP